MIKLAYPTLEGTLSLEQRGTVLALTDGSRTRYIKGLPDPSKVTIPQILRWAWSGAFPPPEVLVVFGQKHDLRPREASGEIKGYLVTTEFLGVSVPFGAVKGFYAIGGVPFEYDVWEKRMPLYPTEKDAIKRIVAVMKWHPRPEGWVRAYQPAVWGVCYDGTMMTLAKRMPADKLAKAIEEILSPAPPPPEPVPIPGPFPIKPPKKRKDHVVEIRLGKVPRVPKKGRKKLRRRRKRR